MTVARKISGRFPFEILKGDLKLKTKSNDRGRKSFISTSKSNSSIDAES